MQSYLAFLWRHRRFLGFGALLAGSASFGQTWFVSLFGAEIRSAYNLGHAGFGAVYSVATLASGLSLLWVGRLVDRLSLERYAVLAYVALAAGCVGMVVSSSVAALCATLFVLRMAGQGMLPHASATSMARHFERDRGKALSVAALGFPVAESILPTCAVAASAWLGWQGAWLGCAMLLGASALPVALALLRAPPVAEVGAASTANRPAPAPRRDWTRRELLRDRRFFLILPALLAAPFISTGIMFHQVHLVDVKGWTLGWLATCYLGYATAKVGGNLVCGPLVDRFTATRLFPLELPALGLGVTLLALGEHPAVGLAYFALAGITTGVSGPITGAYWAERYGLAHLGAIRSLAMSIMVLGSALSPVTFGWLIDSGVTLEALCAWSAVFIVLATILAGVASWGGRPSRALS